MPDYLIVDSSILIFYDRKGKLEDFLEQKKRENFKIMIPEAIVHEIVEEPEEFAEQIKETSPQLANKIFSSVERLNTAIMQGLIEVQVVDYRKYSKLINNVRKHLSRIDEKTEYTVKKGDAELIALVIQLFNETKEKVFVATLDKGLLKALKPFSKQVKYEVLSKVV